MNIARFPNSKPLYDPHLRMVLFAAIVGNQTISCSISYEALMDHFENNPNEPASVFSRHRTAIERKAEKLISAERFESNGSVFIRTEDFL